MGIWRFTSEQNWINNGYKTPIDRKDEREDKKFSFQWPSWAIQRANELGGNFQAIQTVSKLLKEEREKIHVSN